MIRLITSETKRYYEAKVKEAGKVPFLEHQLQETQDNVAMWKAQSEDYLKQRDQERERTSQLTGEVCELQARLNGQQAEVHRQLDESREPVLALFRDLLDRADHPVEGADFRKELALRVLETWVENLSPEDHNSSMGLILRIITNTHKPKDQSEPEPANRNT
ncbi:hypothetical protein ACFV2X_49975 [Streptomyces sp. NPDC059679]|uniref:hypothetical protein n=1 Tax=Streptomyces sp. NPDC059679 TaxID=3346903 RepID=UPI00369551FD